MPRRHSSSVTSSTGLPMPAVAPPALFSRMSMRPNSAMAPSTLACTEAGAGTSGGAAGALGPGAGGGDDVAAGVAEGEGHRPAEAAAGAGDDGDLAVEAELIENCHGLRL